MSRLLMTPQTMPACFSFEDAPLIERGGRTPKPYVSRFWLRHLSDAGRQALAARRAAHRQLSAACW